MPHSFDYVIVGAGTAGCVLANRLSANPARRVLLIEAGPDTPPHAVPAEILDGNNPFQVRLEHRDSYFWPQLNVARTATGRPLDFYEQGRVVGGGSSVNVLIANRGLARDYDRWQAEGAEGWGWEQVLPYFRKLEQDLDFPDHPLHGSDGPAPISRCAPSDWSDFTRQACQALDAHELPYLPDQNGSERDGYFSPTANRRDGERHSAARAYLTPQVRERGNLQIWADSPVLGLRLEGTRATGVEVLRNGQPRVIDAGEVILCAGALQSPALLMRAGIGDAAALAAHGIASRVDSPGVGQNLWDHSSIGVVAPLTESARRAALTSTQPYQLSIRASSGVDAQTPSDLYLAIGANPAQGLAQALMWVNTPSSSGYLTLADRHPLSAPQVHFRLLSDARDLKRLRAGLQLIERLFAHPALAQHQLEPVLSPFAVPRLGGPGLSETLQDEAQLHAYLQQHVGGVWHASGTCRMGRAQDPHAVVDAQGRVHGARQLRVVDASIMPCVPTANTNLPTLMLAEKIADAILASQ